MREFRFPLYNPDYENVKFHPRKNFKPASNFLRVYSKRGKMVKIADHYFSGQHHDPFAKSPKTLG